MADSTLDKLLEAEKRSQKRIDDAREQAALIVKRAGEASLKERDDALRAFSQKRTIYMEKIKTQSSQEAEKIKRDGLEIARGLEGKLKHKIPEAVDAIMREYLNDGSQ